MNGKLKINVLHSIHGDAYDLNHENIAIFPAFENDLLRMKELAIMDLFTLPQEQVKAQLERLDQIKQKFNHFERKNYSTFGGQEPEEKKIFILNLNLQENFVVNGIHPEQYDVHVTDQFLDDLYDFMVAKSEALLKIEEEILSMMHNDLIVKSDFLSIEKPSFISEDNVNDLFSVLITYFNNKDRDKLKDVLANRLQVLLLLMGRGFSLRIFLNNCMKPTSLFASVKLNFNPG